MRRLTNLEKSMGVPIIGSPSNSPSRETNIKIYKNRIYAGSACLLLATGVASCNKTNNEPQSLPPLVAPVTSVLNSTESTTTSMKLLTSCGPLEVVEQGDSISEISKRCKIPLESIVSWNAIADPDKIQSGQTLILAEPSTTTSPVTEPTVAETTIPPETTLVQVVAETVPVVTEPLPNDWFLSVKACAELGGRRTRFTKGQYLGLTLKKLDGYADNQIAAFLATDIPDTFHIRQITASTEGNIGAECLPPASLIAANVPLPIINTVKKP
ncbi:MAG: LysM peptidoglycan-binding domain-containing protein [bacterium]